MLKITTKFKLAQSMIDILNYKNFLKQDYPQAYQSIKNKEIDLPFFCEKIYLSKKHYEQIKKVIQQLYKLRNNEKYHESISQSPKIALKKTKQNSVLMAYDFHLNKDAVKLIEVNTNASGFLLVNSLYQFKKINHQKALKSLRDSFLEEWKSFNPNKKIPKIVLVDENPQNQKMNLEFFMFKDFFKSLGWTMDILDPKDLIFDKGVFYTPNKQKIDFIYNRLTDFYFEKYPFLEQAYKEESCLINPLPKDYYLLADKQRMIDWDHNKDFFKGIQDHLLKTVPLTHENKEELWKNRKNYFFKIAQGFSGKMAYRGKSLTQKKRDELLKFKSVAQEYSPPSQITDSNEENWKIDLRAYAYKDEIQQLTARVYKGQLTNFQTKGGGFAIVKLC